jgi:curved DNA-binding protein CbpA
MVQNFYEVLQVDRNALLDEIKQALKRRALQVHPDKGGTSEGLRKGQGAKEQGKAVGKAAVSKFVETTPPIAP